MRAWPDVLPGMSYSGYELSPVDQVIRTDMEVGARRVRRITQARHDRLSMPFRMTDQQYAAFRAWYGDEVWSLAGASDSLESWAFFNATRVAAAVAGPETGVVADNIVENTTTNTHFARQLIDVPDNAVVVVHGALRAVGDRWGRLVSVRKNGGTPGVTINLATGATSSVTSGITNVSVLNRGGGWWRVRFEDNVLSGATVPQVRAFSALTDGTTNYLGDGASGVSVCEVSARVKSATGDLHLRTDATGRALGAAGGSAWFFGDVPMGGGTSRTELRFTEPWRTGKLPGPNWQVTVPVEVRNA